MSELCKECAECQAERKRGEARTEVLQGKPCEMCVFFGPLTELDEAIVHAEAVAERYGCSKCGVEHKQLAEWLWELRYRRKADEVKRRDEDYGDATALHMLGVRNTLLREAVCRLEWIAEIVEKAYGVPERDREEAYDHALAEILELAKKPLKINDWEKGEER